MQGCRCKAADPSNQAATRSLTQNTGPVGTFLLCLGRDELGGTLSAVGFKHDRKTDVVSIAITNRVTVVRLQLAKR